MLHIDIISHIICLISGFMSCFLGVLLYLKYRIKALKYYSLFILTTILTVAFTSAGRYVSFAIDVETSSGNISLYLFIFQILLYFINLSFTFFSLSLINKKRMMVNSILLIAPLIFIFIIIFFFWTNREFLMSEKGSFFVRLSFFINLGSLFLTFVIQSILIALQLKFMDNLDLKNALKTLAFYFIVYIPIQSLVIILEAPEYVIFTSRNLFYTGLYVISLIYATRYFFLSIPSITDKIEISEYFIREFGLTEREKEITELLVQGLSIKEISGKLNRSFKTVNNHIYNIYKKTKVKSKMELLNQIRENKIA